MKGILLVLMAIGAVCLAAADGNYEITWPASEAGTQLVGIELSGENLENLGGHPDWLRLFDKKGNVVPWALKQLTAPQYGRKHVSLPLVMDMVRHGENGSFEMFCHVKDDAPLPENAFLTIHTTTRDFEQQVVIYGMDDQGQEHVLLPDGFIFENSSNLELKNTTLPFSPKTFRKFLISLSFADLERRAALREVTREWNTAGNATFSESQIITGHAFNIDSLEIWFEQMTELSEIPQWLEYPAAMEAGHSPVGEEATVIIVKPSVYPVSGLHIHCEEANYCRTVRVALVEEDDYSIKSHDLVTDKIKHLELGQVKDETLLLFQRPVADGQGTIQVTIENNDNPPLHVKSIGLRIPAYSLRFLGNGADMPYRLTAEPGGKAPVYETAELLAAQGTTKDMAIVRPSNFIGEPISGDTPSKDNHTGFPRPLLIAAVAIAVIAMAISVASAIKKANAS